jgi:hypothetical protein
MLVGGHEDRDDQKGESGRPAFPSQLEIARRIETELRSLGVGTDDRRRLVSLVEEGGEPGPSREADPSGSLRQRLDRARPYHAPSRPRLDDESAFGPWLEADARDRRVPRRIRPEPRRKHRGTRRILSRPELGEAAPDRSNLLPLREGEVSGRPADHPAAAEQQQQQQREEDVSQASTSPSRPQDPRATPPGAGRAPARSDR